MAGVNIRIIDLFFDQESFMLSLDLNFLLIISLALFYYIINLIIKIFKKNSSVDKDIIPITLKYKLAGAEVEYKIVRNYQNIEIAHRIYIELITRKAAIKIDDSYDVISEIYNSWYSLFQITRNELKTFDGKLLKDNNTSKELIRLLADILNKGLRPHLTQYQAEFRKWFYEEIQKDCNKGKSPQLIQKNFSHYNELITSMKEVNIILISYANSLSKIISG